MGGYFIQINQTSHVQNALRREVRNNFLSFFSMYLRLVTYLYVSYLLHVFVFDKENDFCLLKEKKDAKEKTKG